MLFNSIEFLLFFPVVTIGYFVIPQKMKNIWLLIASYYFYMCWNVKYVLLLLLSTVITFISGILLEKIKYAKCTAERQSFLKKCVVAGSFISNLSILFFFKYANFALNTLTSLLAVLHIELYVPAVDVLLPVGISFYTFQALSYTMDVYRNEIYAEKNFLRYALFVSFFPQLVAGPIERSKNLLKQLDKPHTFNYDRAKEGLLLMLWGMFLKIVLADRIAIFVDTVYGNYSDYPGWYLIVATVLFAVQIYCDFGGYSAIAIGAAVILGITLMENFNAPYLSTSVAEFWRKWHISLTSWFKDYLYIPLGGSRKGKLRKYLNKIIVFLVSGLWHGANYTFCIWGGINGLYQVIGEVLEPLRNKASDALRLNRTSLAHKGCRIILTFIMVDFSWVFFRAVSLTEATEIIKSMLFTRNPWILFDGSIYQCGLDSKNVLVMMICIGILLFADYCKLKGIAVRKIVLKQDYWFQCLFYAASIIVLLIFGIWGPRFDSANFIYFQF